MSITTKWAEAQGHFLDLAPPWQAAIKQAAARLALEEWPRVAEAEGLEVNWEGVAVVLFGSYARGGLNPASHGAIYESDLDVGLLVVYPEGYTDEPWAAGVVRRLQARLSALAMAHATRLCDAAGVSLMERTAAVSVLPIHDHYLDALRRGRRLDCDADNPYAYPVLDEDGQPTGDYYTYEYLPIAYEIWPLERQHDTRESLTQALRGA